MSPHLPYQHGTMLLKYAGISFISGAVNHGFFSGIRSIWTAAIGIVLFVLGAWLEHRSQRDSEPDGPGLVATLLWGSLLSIGLGFFTGGLQHFPDSPARSAWVVPLGFAISVLALWISNGRPWQRSSTAYATVAGLLVVGSSWGAYSWLEANPQWADGGHSHGAPAGMLAQNITRSIQIHMDDSMRFSPSIVEVRAGEVIRFVVHNGGQLPHEFVLGNEKEIAAHAEQMRLAAAQPTAAAHSHGAGAALSVAAGGMGEIVVSFGEATTLQIACLVPGHYEAGMRGTLTVLAPTTVSGPGSAAMPASNHQH